MTYTTLVVTVLLACMGLLGAEVTHCRWCDYCERADHRRSMLMCIRTVGRDLGGPQHPRFWPEVEKEFDKLNLRRKERGGRYLPKHLTGIPAQQILARAA